MGAGRWETKLKGEGGKRWKKVNWGFNAAVGDMYHLVVLYHMEIDNEDRRWRWVR